MAPENGIIFATSVLLTVGVKMGFRTRTASLQDCCEQADLLSTRISASTAASMNAEGASSPVRFPSNAARHAIFALAQPGLSQVLPSSRKKLVRFGHRVHMTKLPGSGASTITVSKWISSMPKERRRSVWFRTFLRILSDLGTAKCTSRRDLR